MTLPPQTVPPQTVPPQAAQQPHEHTQHGVQRLDPYYWMHDSSSPEFLDYLAAERSFYDASCAHLTPLVTALKTEMLARLPDVERSVKWKRMRFSYYTRLATGSDYAELLREKHLELTEMAENFASNAQSAIEPPAEMVLDLNSLADESGYLAIGLTILSPDENWLAYSIDATGDEVFQLRFRDLRTSLDGEEVPRSYYGGAWSADSTYFFYTVHDDAYRPCEVWRHHVGTPTNQDVLVLREPDARFELNLRATRSGDAIIIWSESNSTSESWFLDANDPLGTPYSIGGRRHGIRYQAEHRRGNAPSNPLGDLLIVTNDNAVEFRLMTAPIPTGADQDSAAWQELIAENPGERLLCADAFAEATVLTVRTDGTTALRWFRSEEATSRNHTIASELPGGELSLSSNELYDTDTITIHDESWLYPSVWSDLDLVSGERAQIWRAESPGHDPDRYLTERHTFPSADGTPVPVTLLRHRDTPLDGTAPCLLYGYGAYESVFEPEWDPALPSLLDRGVVYAYAHIRGGGEGGRQWYLDGKLGRKQHTFDDHIAVADGLANQGFVDPSRIMTRGLSAGGLLQAAIFSQRPDRWCAVLAEVPFVDVVTTMFDKETPLTATEWEEWGDPRIREEFDWMSAYDPIQNVPASGTRTDLLVTGTLHDPRVMVREPAKWVATLRATDPAWSPRCLFRVETGAGAHSGPSGRVGHLAYEAEVYAWLLSKAGPSLMSPKSRARRTVIDGSTGMNHLHQEVIELTQSLIRMDTTNGNETQAARFLAEYLTDAGVECEMIARDPARANLVARIPGNNPEAESLAFVGHLDVVPADPRDWSHPPFAAELTDDGYLFGRGAVDMKNEVAARAVALAELARNGFKPSGDLWLIMVADEEDGIDDVGMRWLLESRPDIRPDLAINEGGGSRYELTNGRIVVELSIGEKGTQPARVVALGEAGHASMPTLGDNAVPHLGTLLTRVGRGTPRPVESPLLAHTLAVLLGREVGDPQADMAEAATLHPILTHLLPPLRGITMAPTMVGGSAARNVMPARAWMDLDCRILPGMTRADVEAEVRTRLGHDVAFDIEWPDQLVPGSTSPPGGRLPTAIAEFLKTEDPDSILLPLLCTGYTDSSFLRLAAGTAAYGFSPFLSTPADVIAAGYHNADERVHVDDLLLSVRFHIDLAQRLLT